MNLRPFVLIDQDLEGDAEGESYMVLHEEAKIEDDGGDTIGMGLVAIFRNDRRFQV